MSRRRRGAGHMQMSWRVPVQSELPANKPWSGRIHWLFGWINLGTIYGPFYPSMVSPWARANTRKFGPWNTLTTIGYQIPNQPCLCRDASESWIAVIEIILIFDSPELHFTSSASFILRSTSPDAPSFDGTFTDSWNYSISLFRHPFNRIIRVIDE